MAVFKPFLFFIIFVHFLAFALAVVAELGRREVTFISLVLTPLFLFFFSFSNLFHPFTFFQVQGIPNVDQIFCLYYTFASTIYGFGACVLMLISQVFLNTITKCLCFSSGLVSSRSATCASFFFVVSW